MKRPEYETRPIFCITSDVDWASEAALQIQQDIFDARGIHATYFVTHHSPLIECWYQGGKVDLGIHPNFLPGSSHGDSIDEVIDSVMQFAPNARCFRAHRFFDVTLATHALVRRGILYDSNLCTNLQQGIAPIAHESGLIRFPCFYEDGTHFGWRRSWDFAQFTDIFMQPGIKILNVHPMITALNVVSSESWAELKGKFPPDEWVRMSSEDINKHASTEPGPRRFLEDLLDYVKDERFRIMTMEQLYCEFGREDKARDRSFSQAS